jgi:NAD-dependent SIR2 family protein deacetylase
LKRVTNDPKDFRSENGLYSLIQAQFDDAKRSDSQSAEVETTEDAAQARDTPDGPPAKRRRLDAMGGENSRDDVVLFPRLQIRARRSFKKEADAQDRPICLTPSRGNDEVDSGSPPSDHRQGSTTAAHGDGSPQTSSSPLSSPMSVLPNDGLALPLLGDVDTSNGLLQRSNLIAATARPSAASTPQPAHLARIAARITSLSSSSPLSSPPQTISDPYERSFASSSARSTASDSLEDDSAATSESGDTPPSSHDFSASQGSSSGRVSLPNLKGKDLFDASIWQDPVKTSIFYTFITNLRKRTRDVQPGNTHRFISTLRDRRKLVRCYTQNIDQLEEKVGLTTQLGLGAGYRYRFGTRPSLKGGVPSRLQAEGNESSGGASGPKCDPRDGAAEVQDKGAEECVESQAAVLGGDQMAKEESSAPDIVKSERGTQAEPGKSQTTTQTGEAEGAGPRSKLQLAEAAFAAKPGEIGPKSHASDSGKLDGEHIRANEGSSPVKNEASSAEHRTAVDTVEHCGSEDSQPRDQDLASATTTGVVPAAQDPSSVPPELPVPKDETSQPSATDYNANSEPAGGPPLRGGVECVYLHGSLESLRCFQCSRTSEWEGGEMENATLSGRQPDCPHCAGATAAREERGKRALGVGKLRPDIVLYGEEHPQDHLIAPIVEHDIGLGPDMLIIMGTSLRVYGLSKLVKQFSKAVHSKGGKVIFVNYTKPPESVWADVIDYWVEWDCDAWVENLKERKPAIWDPSIKNPIDDSSDSASGKLKRQNSSSSVKMRRASTQEVKAAQVDGDTAAKAVPKVKRTNSGLAPAKPKRVQKPKVEAKRPMAVRDDKFAAAFIVDKIMDDLAKWSARERLYRAAKILDDVPPAVSLASKSEDSVPRKRPSNRKSAPSALGDIGAVRPDSLHQPKLLPGERAQSKKSNNRKLVDLQDNPATPLPLATKPLLQQTQIFSVPLQTPVNGNSILAAVKSNPRQRKRKTFFHGEEIDLPSPRLSMPALASQTPTARPALPPPRKVTPIPPPQLPYRYQYRPSPASSSPMTVQLGPPAHLAPLVNEYRRDSAPRLHALEPPVADDGPQSPYSSPREGGSPHSQHSRGSVGHSAQPSRSSTGEPFAFHDPLARRLEHPPDWLARSIEVQPRAMAEVVVDSSPNKQLKDEARRDAAMALATLCRMEMK